MTDTYEKLEQELNTKIGKKLGEEAKINIKPRLRMTTLYAIAQNYNYLVMGTGNLCEAMVGYTTKWEIVQVILIQLQILQLMKF